MERAAERIAVCRTAVVVAAVAAVAVAVISREGLSKKEKLNAT